MFAALGNLHAEHDHRGIYQERCLSCLENEVRYGDRNNGCKWHRGAPVIWTRGDPRTSEILQHAVKTFHKQGATYQANGDSPLLPDELQSIRNTLLATNEMWDFMFWVMIVIGVKLFLREDEV